MTRLPFLAVAAMAIFGAAPLHGDPHADKNGEMKLSIAAPSSLKWLDGPPSLPAGAKIAILEGDPTKEGPFVFRAKLPDGYRVPPHVHPKVERITVIAGTFNVGMGETFDASKTTAMPAGSYGFWPAGMKHFVWAKGETIIQFHGMGPWGIQYLNTEDDPRNQRRRKEDLRSGPQAGEKLPGAFHSLVVVSKEPTLVGKNTDFLEYCGQNPVVLVFARALSEPLTSLLARLEAETISNKSARLQAIVIILSDEQDAEENLKDYCNQQRIKNVHLAMMPSDGPKHFNLSKEADLTAVTYKRQQVVANRAFKKGEFNDEGVARILIDVSQILPKR
jgi:hypothetical protein